MCNPSPLILDFGDRGSKLVMSVSSIASEENVLSRTPVDGWRVRSGV